MIEEKKPLVMSLKDGVSGNDGTNEMCQKIDDILKDVESLEKKLDDRKTEVDDLVSVAEQFDESVNKLEDWKPKTAVLEEPISMTKEGAVEQMRDLKVSKFSRAFAIRNVDE